jgi:uncharacterized alkaline shock family protein YloU
VTGEWRAAWDAGAAGYYSTMPDPDRGIDQKALESLVRRAAAGVYGVARVGGGGWRARLLRLLGRGAPGVQATSERPLRVELDLALVPGVPAAQVARNVEDAVRYLVQRDLGVAIEDLLIRVDGVPAASR